MGVIELPKLGRAASLLAEPDEEEDGGLDDELERQELLNGPQQQMLANAALVLVARSRAKTLEEALELLEAWSPEDAAKHPRWPEGTPGGLGGKFMHAGQRFRLGGTDYDVAFTVPGGVYAHVATKGQIAKAKTVFVPAKEIEKAERPPAVHTDYSHTPSAKASGLNLATVVDPYVAADHDPKIPAPADAPASLTPERWQRFGRADQLRYVDLMHQFGPWSDNVAQTKVDAELSKQPHDLVAFLKSAYASQFGSSSGFTIGLLQVFSKWFGSGKAPSQAELEKDREKYEQTKRVQDAAARVIQWDLYNRVASPDITVFHKSHDAKSWWDANIVSGHKPVFSGLSQTQRYSSGGFGPVGVATPLAIRHIVMATTSADVYKEHHFGGEQEVSVAEPIRLDGRSLVFNDSDLTTGQKGWLTQNTQSGADGTIVGMLRASLEHGEALPALPEPPNIQIEGENAQWIAPPPPATIGIDALDYAEKDADGVPIARPAKELDLKPGDYIEGMKGTRYIVLADAGSSFGIRYFKVTDSGHPVGMKKPYSGQLHDAGTGHQAYGGHKSWLGSGYAPESYEFTIDLPFKKLAGHYDLPSQAASATLFVPKAWTLSGDKLSLKALPTGAKFYVGATAYEKQGSSGSAHVAIKSLTTGNYGTASAGYVTNYLKLKQGYTEEGVPAFDPGEFFTSKPATLSELGLSEGDLFLAGQSGTSMAWQVTSTHGKAPLEVVGVGSANQGKKNILALSVAGRKLTPKPAGWTPPQPGDTLAYEGKKGTVTKLLKNGYVQVNLAPGVVKLAPDDPLLAGAFSPQNHQLGPKLKVKDMLVGQKFHGGTGGKIRPYVVVELGVKQKGKPGSFARVRNLDTGEDTLVGYQKAYATLQTHAQMAPAEPGEHHDVAAVFNPSAWKAGKETTTSELKIGDKFQSPVYGLAEVTGDKGAALEAKGLETGATFPVLKSSVPVQLLEPSDAMPAIVFDPYAYGVMGIAVTLKDVKAGDIFKGKAKGKHYLVTKTGAKSGLTAVDLQTGKLSGPWKYATEAYLMKPKTATLGAELGAVSKPGDAVQLNQLKPGDQFLVAGQLHELVMPPQPGEGLNATVAPVLPGGALGFPGKVGWYPTLAVTFAESAADAAEKKKALQVAAKAGALSPGVPVTLAAGTTFGPYSPKSKTGGGYVFVKAKHAAEGQILEDKEGSQFKVVSAGADPIVSDGSVAHWKMPGESNMKVVDVPFHDKVPPSPASQDAAAAHAVLEAPVLEAQEPGQQKTFAELGLAKGDWFMSGGKLYKVTEAVPDGGVLAKQATQPKTTGFGPQLVPDLFGKKGAADSPIAQVDISSAPATAAEKGLTWDSNLGPQEEKKKLSDMPVGTHVKSITGSEFEVVAQVGAKTKLKAVIAAPGGAVHAVGEVFENPNVWTPPYALPASPTAAVSFSGAEFTDNSLVKLQASMLKPGQLFKAGSVTWLMHGPLKPGFVSAEAVGGGTAFTKPGKIAPIEASFVPDAVGPVVPFAASEWQSAGEKVLLSAVKPGQVYSATPGKGQVVKAIGWTGDGKLNVVSSTPSGATSEPYTIDVVPGVPVHLMQPKAAPTLVPVKLKTLHVGDHFKPEGVDPGPWVVTKITDDFVFAKSTSSVAALPFGKELDVEVVAAPEPKPGSKAKLLAKLDAEGQPTWMPENTGGMPLKPNLDAETLGDLKPGDQFSDGDAVWEVTSSGADGVLATAVNAPPGSPAQHHVDTGVQAYHEPGDVPLYIDKMGDPAAATETDEYLVQALVDAHAKGDQEAYDDAANELADYLGLHGADPSAAKEFEDFVQKVVAERGLKEPGTGAAPFGGGAPYSPSAPADLEMTPLSNLTVGAEFEDHKGLFGDVGDKYVITKDAGGEMTLEPIGSQGEGLDQTIPADDMRYEDHVSVLSWGDAERGPHGLKPGDPVVYVGNDPSILGAIEQGDKFHFVSHDAATGAVVLGDDSDQPGSWDAEPGDIEPEAGFGEGQAVAGSALEVGDHVVTASHAPWSDPSIVEPAVWKVTAHTPAGTEMLQVKQAVWKDGQTAAPAELTHVFSPGTTWKKVPAPTGAPTSAPTLPPTWKPYSPNSKSGGGHKFADLGDLAPGTVFTDKTGTQYVATSKTADGYYTHFRPYPVPDPAAPPHRALSGTRVKIVP